MQLAGEAVREGQFLVNEGNSLKRGLKCIGVCSWGYTHNNKVAPGGVQHSGFPQALVNTNLQEFHHAKYNSNMEIKSKHPVPLNADHTHFLMVDDGYRNNYFGNGGITEFIAKLETLIAAPKESGGLGVPLITLLLEGGTDAIYEVKDNLASGQPCVVVEGSGRAADILAYAHRHATRKVGEGAGYSLRRGNLERIEKMLEESFADRLKGETGAERKKKVVNWVIECIHHADLITVFDIRDESNLDYKILTALLKGKQLNIYAQLYLAMLWDRYRYGL